MQADHVGAPQKLVEGDPPRVLPAVAGVVDDLHGEASGPRGYCPGDLAIADEAQPPAVNVRADHDVEVDPLPSAAAYQQRGLHDPTSRGQDQSPGEICRRLVEHSRGVRDANAAPFAADQVDVVGPRAHRSDQPEALTAVEHCGVDRRRAGAHDDGGVGAERSQLVRAGRAHVLPHFDGRCPRQSFQRVARQGPSRHGHDLSPRRRWSWS